MGESALGEGEPEFERYRADSDGDGLSDKWEQLTGRNPEDGHLILHLIVEVGRQRDGGRKYLSQLAGKLGARF